ncbi:MAG: META domain-containing protein [Psychroflexus sp.]|nr:META domain-containing protein [Psychroflexus sp.]MDN6309497.1 META domain-containing protein [Psychroflexus sp.]
MSCKVAQSGAENSALQSANYHIIQLNQQDVSDGDLEMNIIAKESKIYGFSGCNTYHFNYQLKDDKLDMGDGISTKKYCEGQMDLENLFFEMTSQIDHFEQEKEGIIFKNQEGEIIIKALKD